MTELGTIVWQMQIAEYVRRIQLATPFTPAPPVWRDIKPGDDVVIYLDDSPDDGVTVPDVPSPPEGFEVKTITPAEGYEYKVVLTDDG